MARCGREFFPRIPVRRLLARHFQIRAKFLCVPVHATQHHVAMRTTLVIILLVLIYLFIPRGVARGSGLSAGDKNDARLERDVQLDYRTFFVRISEFKERVLAG